MRQLEPRHILLFRILQEPCSFLIRRQIELVLTLPTNTANKQLKWLLEEQYLKRRYRSDTFSHFQTPVYYLGVLGWRMVGRPPEEYKRYKVRIEQRSERQLEHDLLINDVLLKFLLETEVNRLIHGESEFWQEAIDFGNVPDAWIQYDGGAAFIEADRSTESPIVLQRKFEKYENYRNSGQYSKLFPNCMFKVLVVTTTEEWIETLEKRVVSDDIWFCTQKEFVAESLNHEHWFALDGFYALPAVTKKEV